MENKLRAEYEPLEALRRESLRAFLKELGELSQIRPLTKEELQEIGENGGICVSDGSNNRFGGAKPHYVDFYQSVAFITGKNKDKKVAREILSPLFDQEEQNPLAAMEIRVVLEILEEKRPVAVMLDGSLIRFAIEASKPWEELKSICIEKKIPLIGVIEDIKTKKIGESFKARGVLERVYYDREILFGNLEYGEALLLQSNSTGKSKEGLSSLFLKSSYSPNPIGIDLPEEQESFREWAAALVISLSSKRGRGIPMIMDMVDVEARIGDEALEKILKESVSPSIFERLLNPIRNKRSY